MAPHYEPPAAPVQAAYEHADVDATATPVAPPAGDIGWKEFFPDPELQGLLSRALANNRDLRIATLNVEAARAQYRIQRAEQLPAIDAQGSSTNARASSACNSGSGKNSFQPMSPAACATGTAAVDTSVCSNCAWTGAAGCS